jgi:hypothetical protein
VFGRPCAGKSFGVKAIAGHVAPGDLHSQEINLAQLSSPEDLVREFHVARDTILDGRTPLIFFDEFDCSAFDRQLGWLPYFLEPMQDGTFRDHGRQHALRRAIFVFAGGTAKSLDEFRAFATQQGYQDKKLPDFVSRLQGFLQIAGTDCLTPDNPESDAFFELRRAVLLRSQLTRLFPALQKPDGSLSISRDVLRAFLFVKNYRHGARSIEALIRMSALYHGSEVFETAMLPPDAQIDLHADARSFRIQLQGADSDAV